MAVATKSEIQEQIAILLKTHGITGQIDFRFPSKLVLEGPVRLRRTPRAYSVNSPRDKRLVLCPAGEPDARCGAVAYLKLGAQGDDRNEGRAMSRSELEQLVAHAQRILDGEVQW